MNSDMPPPLNNSGESGAPSDTNFGDGLLQTTRKLQLLRAGSLLLGVFEDEIATIADWRRPAPLPHAPPAVLGVVSIQGRMLTVLDLMALCLETVNREGPSRGFLIALRGDEQIALAVEDKAGVLELANDRLQPPSDTARGLMLGTISTAGQIVNVLDVKALFPAAIKGRERRRRRFQ